ncbi:MULTISPECIES: hypothetical protein [unclassified Streptomyces]|uniref:hypothetical protein n=1 Tax=unclassified Streptomyces TaxID=2593676 RepID=UPI00341FB373
MSVKKTSMIAATVAVAAVAGIGTTASAYAAGGIATDTVTITLTDSPTTANADSCHNRHIKLNEDSYLWGLNNGSNPPVDSYKIVPRSGSWISEWITLDEGYYTWTDCLIAQNGYYIQKTTLDPDAAGKATAVRFAAVTVTMTGSYTWGTFLAPSSSARKSTS